MPEAKHDIKELTRENLRMYDESSEKLTSVQPVFKPSSEAVREKNLDLSEMEHRELTRILH
jgi:hypothetical protein